MLFSTHFFRNKKTSSTIAAMATIPPAAYSIGKLNSGLVGVNFNQKKMMLMAYTSTCTGDGLIAGAHDIVDF